jgi:hypothetical protein
VSAATRGTEENGGQAFGIRQRFAATIMVKRTGILLMKRWILICVCLLVMAVPLRAQDDGYAEAQRRIDEALASGATELDLSGLGLTKLPDSIGQLMNLQNLDVNDNRLTMLPDNIGQLTNLYHLKLINNQLQTLPDSIGNLQNLGSG